MCGVMMSPQPILWNKLEYLGKLSININYFSQILCRHVHITEATLYKLNNEYHVEPYLTEPFPTFLIVPYEVFL